MRARCSECGRYVEVLHASSSDLERGSDHEPHCTRFMAVSVMPSDNIIVESATYSPDSSFVEARPVFLGLDRATCDHLYPVTRGGQCQGCGETMFYTDGSGTLLAPIKR